MDVMDTIMHPWRNPIDYAELVFWIVIFAIFAFAMYDMLRILAAWIKQAAS